MSVFQKYDSIENSNRQKFVADCISAIQLGYCEDNFVVEEKAHGANFAFYFDGEDMKTACRSTFLENDGETFSKSHLVKQKYSEHIQALYALLGNNQPIRVVGEIIGGCYEHPEVEPAQNLPRIQKGVQYCPTHEFYAFDLFIQSNETRSNGGVVYNCIDKMETNRLFEKVGLLYAKPLFQGTLAECLAYGNTFKSHIPGWLGLPEHPGDNIAEGKVIKPVVLARLGNGARIILKDKADQFMEVAYGDHRPQKKQKTAAAPEPELSEEGKALWHILCAHVTENRLDNVLSKLPETCTLKDCGKVCGLLSKDALGDFKKDYGDDFDALEPKERKTIQKLLASQAMAAARASLSGSQIA